MVFAYISDVTEPRALAQILEKAEACLASKLHPDPYIRESPRFRHITSKKLSFTAPSMPGGTKWYVAKFLFSYSSLVEFKTHVGNAIYLYVSSFAFVPLYPDTSFHSLPLLLYTITQLLYIIKHRIPASAPNAVCCVEHQSSGCVYRTVAI
jgi:hypothetical protein